MRKIESKNIKLDTINKERREEDPNNTQSNVKPLTCWYKNHKPPHRTKSFLIPTTTKKTRRKKKEKLRRKSVKIFLEDQCWLSLIF